MKKCAILGISLALLVACMMSPVLALEGNGAPEITIAGDITPDEVPMEINCTWSHGPSTRYSHPAIIGWDVDNTIPPLPNSGWGNEILSISVVQPMYVNIVVTDSFSKGDYFEVWEVDGVNPTSGHYIGTTPIVPVAGGTTGLPDPAFADPTYSHGIFRVFLISGTHYFAFREAGHYFGSGAYYVKFCPVHPPVGGSLLPVDKLVAGTPLIILVSVFSAVLILAAVKKRRF